MKNESVLEYKGYYTKVEYSAEDQILYGRIEGISDLVNFECESAAEVEAAFHEAVDDYLIFCEEIGQEPNKTYKGSFNIRIPPELHKAADIERLKEGITLNQLIINALDEHLNPKQKERIIAITLPMPLISENKRMRNAVDVGKESIVLHNQEVRYARS